MKPVIRWESVNGQVFDSEHFCMDADGVGSIPFYDTAKLRKHLKNRPNIEGVYCWRKDGVWTYVGRSRNLQSRVSSKHSVLPTKLGVDDLILLYECPNAETCKWVENYLIRSLKPIRNSYMKGKLVLRKNL
jgi:hypothetical protein